MHSFIDPTKLNIQNPTDTFGVDASDPINKFNITSMFELVEKAKAFACQDGMMIVQPSEVNDTLVNVIIKPIESLKVNFNTIKYYVYREIEKKSLLIDKDKIALEETTNNEFIARLWKDHKQFKIDFKLPNHPNPTPKVFGYTDSLPSNLNIEKIYDNSQEELRPLFVKQGEWFGDFTNNHKIGFEIVTSNDRINIDLTYLRKSNHQIDATDLNGLALRAKKEEILSFIDPAAFFGLHYNVGVQISTFSGVQKTTDKIKKQELFDLLIKKFATKHRVYLDIRSELGYSYNFYQNYKEPTINV